MDALLILPALMKYPAILCLLLAITSAFGQAVETKQFLWKKQKMDYAFYQPEGEVKQVLIALVDAADASWKCQSWAQELTWLANKRSAIIVAPAPAESTLDENAWRAFLSGLEGAPSIDSVFFVILGAGIKASTTLINMGLSGLVIAPTDSLPISNHELGVIALIDSRGEDQSERVRGTLEASGAWVLHRMIISEHPYYFDERQPIIFGLFHELDSLNAVLSDESKSQALQSALLTSIPEVLRQGVPIKMEIFVAQQGKFVVEVHDLSGAKVYTDDRFFGKGKHPFILPTRQLDWGVYKIVITGPGFMVKQKFMVRG
jgi:hypothetical protein